MKFSHQTLRSTCRQFDNALKDKGLDLSWETTQNTWSRIVLGKNYSSAVADANANGPLQAIPVSNESIQSLLRHRNRTVDDNTATTIFAAAVAQDIAELSPPIGKLIEFVRSGPGICVMKVHGDGSGVGLLQSDRAGYLPISEINAFGLTSDEIAWLHDSSDLIVDTINALGGKSTRESFDIFAASHRVGQAKSDTKFRAYFGARVDQIAIKVAEAVLREFQPNEIAYWDPDFDTIRDIVFSVFDVECDDEDNWLKPDCDLADAVIDHVTARVRESLKWMMEQAEEDEVEFESSPVSSLAHTSKLAMTKLLNA